MKAMLSKYVDDVIGSALPYLEPGDAQQKALATTVIAGGILSKYLSGAGSIAEILLEQHSTPTWHVCFACCTSCSVCHGIQSPIGLSRCSAANALTGLRVRQSTDLHFTCAMQTKAFAHWLALGPSRSRFVIADEERLRLFTHKAVTTIGHTLLTAADGMEPIQPFFPVKTVLAAISKLPAHKKSDMLWGKASFCCIVIVSCCLKLVLLDPFAVLVKVPCNMLTAKEGQLEST